MVNMVWRDFYSQNLSKSSLNVASTVLGYNITAQTTYVGKETPPPKEKKSKWCNKEFLNKGNINRRILILTFKKFSQIFPSKNATDQTMTHF